MREGYFRVRVWRNHHMHRVGPFASIEEAIEARDQLLDELDKPKLESEGLTITGVTAEELPDFESAYNRALEEYQKRSLTALRKMSQRLAFPGPRVCIVFAADQHIGNPGTDIERVFEEARITAEMPNTFSVCLGDVVDSFITPKLLGLNMNTRIAIKDQWVLAEEYVKIMHPIAWVSGNHEGWSQDMTGMDHLRRIISYHVPHALYDTDDCRVTIEVGGVEFPARFRHKWRGRSIYSATHGIERAQKWDQDFILGVGAHDHTAGVSRQFPAGGRMGLAILCGSFKRLDTYQEELGLPKMNNSTSIAVLFDAENESMTAFDNMNAAQAFMEATAEAPSRR